MGLTCSFHNLGQGFELLDSVPPPALHGARWTTKLAQPRVRGAGREAEVGTAGSATLTQSGIRDY